jgi:hypothetical protein
MADDAAWLELLATLPIEQQFVVRRAQMVMQGASRQQLIELVSQYMVQSYVLEQMNEELLRHLEFKDEPPT